MCFSILDKNELRNDVSIVNQKPGKNQLSIRTHDKLDLTRNKLLYSLLTDRNPSLDDGCLHKNNTYSSLGETRLW
jgi:hypothetical protein